LIRETREWPPHVGNWLAFGFKLRRDTEIRGRFEEWCRRNPTYPEVFILKAQLKARDGDLAGAAVDDRAGLKVAPYSLRLRAQLTLHLQLARRWKEALTAADSVIQVASNHFDAHCTRVRCLAELGRGDEAKAALERVQRDFPARSSEIETLRRSLGD